MTFRDNTIHLLTSLTIFVPPLHESATTITTTVIPSFLRVSISDIVLAQSIMTRKALTEPPPPPPPAAAAAAAPTANANAAVNQSNNATATSSSSSSSSSSNGVGVGVLGGVGDHTQPEAADNSNNNNNSNNTKATAGAPDNVTPPLSSHDIEEPSSAGEGIGPAGNTAPSYTFSLNLGSMSWVGINDFNGQNVPVVRALLDGTTFYAEG